MKGLKSRTGKSDVHLVELELPGGRFRTVYAVNGHQRP